MLRALAYGGIGGFVGAGIYYGVLYFTGYEFVLVALVVGLLVGHGIRMGSGGAGGRVYQLLAVAMTYLAIVSTYVPFVVDELFKEIESAETQTLGDAGVQASEVPEGQTTAEVEPIVQPGSVASYVVAAVVIGLIAIAVPFLAGVENVVGVLIIGFAVYVAWRVTAYEPFEVEGPFRRAEAAAEPSSPA